MGVNGQNRQLSTMTERFSAMRTGVVVSVNPFFVLVDVGGTVIEAAFVMQSRPAVDELVAVMRQGASWFVLGTSSATGGNGILNGSFEDVDDAEIIQFWTLYNVTNTANWHPVEDDQAVGDGNTVLEVVPATAATSTSIIYSSPVPATTGQTVELSVYVNGFYPGANVNTSDGDLRALWFPDAATLYPATSAADTVIEAFTNIIEIQEGPMRVLTGTAVVPAATAAVRVGLRSVVADSAGLHWDAATCRVLS